MSDFHEFDDDEENNSSSSYKPLFITALVVYFLYLVITTAPASIAAWAAHKAVPNLWLTNEQGTLWKGFSRGAQVDLGRESIALGRVDWSLSPLSLLMLKPCIRFETDGSGQTISGNFCQSPFGGTSVENANFEAPVSMVKALLPDGAQASGNISLQVISAKMNQQKVRQLDARFSWQNASVNVGDSWISLGSFGGTAAEDGDGGVSAKLVDIDGPVGLDLTAGWAPGAKDVSVKGRVEPKQGTPEMIVQALQVFGEETGDGAYNVTWP